MIKDVTIIKKYSIEDRNKQVYDLIGLEPITITQIRKKTGFYLSANTIYKYALELEKLGLIEIFTANGKRNKCIYFKRKSIDIEL